MKPKVLFTLDWEVGDLCMRKNLNPIPWSTGEVGLDRFGPLEIAKMINSYGFKVDFYLSILDLISYPNLPYRELSGAILKLGNDIHLHTHPLGLRLGHSAFLADYSKEEISYIIKKACILFKEVIGFDPVGHRSGSYSVNKDIIDVLFENGFLFDTSYVKNPNCKIWNGFKDKPEKIFKLLQIPITMRETYSTYKGIKIPFKKTYSKIDINWSDADDIISFYENNNSENFTIFMHSFSFVDFRNGMAFQLNNKKIQELEKILKYLQFNQIESITAREISNVWNFC